MVNLGVRVRWPGCIPFPGVYPRTHFPSGKGHPPTLPTRASLFPRGGRQGGTPTPRTVSLGPRGGALFNVPCASASGGGIAAAWWRSDGGRRALALPCPLRGVPRAAPQPGCPGGQGGGAELGAPPWRAAKKRMVKRAKVRPGHLLRFGPLQSSSQSARGARNSGADAARQRP